MDRSYYIEIVGPDKPAGDRNSSQDTGPARSFAAFRLDSIGSAKHDASDRLAYLNQFLSRQIDFIAVLPSIGPDSALEIRLNSMPVESAPQRGEIVVAVRVRSNGATAKQSTETLLEVIDCIQPNLISISDAYQWRPITSKEEYEAIFHAIEPRHLSELIRREALLPLDRLQALPRKRPLGFISESARSSTEQSAESDVYYVFPYVRTYSSLGTLCNVLLMGSQRAGISFAIKPTQIRDHEIRVLREDLERCETFLGHVPHYASDGSPLGAPLRHRANKLLEAIHSFTFSLLDDCFHLRTTVVSASPISSGIMETLGTTVSESVSSKDPYSDANLNADNLKGGYEWMHADGPDQRKRAAHSLRLLEFQPWVPSVARQGADRLRYLADASQANSIFRMPIPLKGGFPGLRTRHARLTPPPKDLPESGLCLGDNNFRGIRQAVNLLEDDRRRHMYMVGQTGTGKSTLLQQMVMQDIINGEGVCLIDPHGELVDQVLGKIPLGRAQDVVYIDPTDPKRTVGLNLLEFRDNLDRDSAINHLLEIFAQLYDMRVAGGPIFEQYLRNSALLATTSKETTATLADIGRILTDPSYRKRQLALCKEPLVKDFWRRIGTKTQGEHSLENLAAYVTSKFTRIAANSLMRQIVLQDKSTVDFLYCMKKRKIVLIDLAKGRLGDTNSRFLGMVLMSLLTRAAFARSEASDPGELDDFYLYVDEFQSLATENFSTILSEARKYRLNLIVSNQYFHQIPKELQDAVIGNAGTILSFRAGLQDAEMLETRFASGVSRYDLMALENYHAYLVTLIDGNATPVFDVETREPIVQYDPEVARSIKLASNRKHTRSRRVVEESIATSFSAHEKTQKKQ